MKKVLLVLNIIFSLLLLANYSIIYISHSQTLVIAILPFIFTFLLGINAFFIILWLFIKWKYSFISLISIIVGIKYITLIIPLNSYFTSGSETSDFKIMSYNVMVFGLYDYKNYNDINTGIIDLIAEEKPDILCLQEAYWNNTSSKSKSLDVIQDSIEAKYIYKSAMAEVSGGQNFGFATISKYPIINSYSEKFEDSFNGYIYTDLLLDKDTIRVYNLYLQSLQFDQKDYTLIENITDGTADRRVKTILKKYIKSIEKRSLQAKIVKVSIDSCTYPIIVAGDFNDVPISYSYNAIAKDLKDSFSSQGSYPGYTWEFSSVKVRIDYILYDTFFKCNSHKIINKNLSDHYAIVAGMSFKK